MMVNLGDKSNFFPSNFGNAFGQKTDGVKYPSGE